MSKRKYFTTCLLMLCFLALAQAQTHFDAWTTDDGLPQNTVLSIARTGDGYLWLGTYEGLARFDGVDFTVFDSVNTPEIKSNYILALLADRQGNLWIGTDGGGLVRRAGDKFFRYSIADGLVSDRITCLLEDKRGSLWIGSDNGGLNVLRDGQLIGFSVADGLPDNHIRSLAEDDAGGIWIGTSNGLSYSKDGRFTNYFTAGGLSSNYIQSLEWSPTEGLWIGTSRGLNRQQNGEIKFVTTIGEIDDRQIHKILVTVGGDLIICPNGTGLYRRRRGQNTFEKMFDETANETIRDLYEDSDGTLWIGTYSRGLLGLQKERFYSFTPADGFPEAEARAVFQDDTGGVWFGNGLPLRHFKNGVLTTYQPKQTLIQYVKTINDDKDGNIWIGGANGLSKFDGQRFTALTTKDGLSQNDVCALLGDRNGNIWAGTTEGGLNKLSGGRFTVYKKEQGLADNFVIALFEDRAGAIWIGTNNGFSRLQNEELMTWRLGEGVASNAVNAFYEDGDGGLWIGTSGGGLYRFKNGEFKVITSRDGLFDNLAFSIVESGGDLWMSGNKGVYRANLQELNDFADGRRNSVNSYNYDAADGMISRECNGNPPAAWKTLDGAILYPTIKGLVRLDPQTKIAPLPSVLIERVRLENETQPNTEALTVQPSRENLEIKYTAMSWQRPRRIKFKYRLEGLDADWTEAGTRRTAYYPYLPPGEYTFQVIADNGEGVWNETGKSMKIKVLPPFYRTWWFFALCCLAIGGIIFLIYRRRFNQLEKARAAQEEFSRQLLASQERERQRIAAELHDTLGQSLLIIKNRVALAQTDVDERETVEEQLFELSQSATAAIEECREIAYNLRPYQISRFGLSKTLHAIFMRLSEVTPINATAEIDDIDNLLPPEAEINIYRIVQETVNNIIKHSGASEALLAIKRGDKEITLVIEDDGRGFTPSAAAVKTNGKSGFGLIGIAERVKMLQGVYEIESAPESGTRIRIKFEIMNGKKV